MGKGQKIKLETKWLSKSLENLEKNVWPNLAADEGSYLVRTCNALRKKQLKDFSTEDLRIMIGQDIGLQFLIPLAIQTLEKDILAEGDFYPGDLFKSVLTSDKNYWKSNKDNWNKICDLVEKNMRTLKEADTTHATKKGWFDSYKDFRQL